MARTRTTTIEEIDPMEEAVLSERSRLAGSLTEALEGLAEFDETGATFKVYKIPRGNGQKYGWCLDIYPPFDITELMTHIKANFGAGDYCIRVYVDGKPGIQAQRNFSIAQELTTTKPEGTELKDILPLMIAQMNGSKSDMMAMMQMQAQQSQQMMQMLVAMMSNSATQQASLMSASQQSQASMITALMGGREKPADLIAAFAPLMANKSGGGFGEMVEMIKAVKEIAGGGGESEGGIAELAIKTLGPSLPALAEGIASLRRPPQEQQVVMLPQQPNPQPAPQTIPIQIAPPPAEVVSKYPLLQMIKPDILFYFQRGADPEFAAEGVHTVLEKAGFTENDFGPIIAAFLAAGENWLTELSKEGLDLTSNPQWALDFLNALIAEFSDANGDTGGAEGGPGHDGDNGGSGETRVSADANTQQSGELN